MTEAEMKANLEKILDKWYDTNADSMAESGWGTCSNEIATNLAEACMVVMRTQRDTSGVFE